MSKCILRDNTVICDYDRPYIVAEVNSSHNGDSEVAKHMIDAAVEAGADCVKFQSWSAESLYSKTYYDANPISKRIIKKLSMTPEQLVDMSHYCLEKGIAFSSTPYSEEEVDFLVDACKAPFIKVSSMEINNLKFLSYIGSKGVPIVLSTGMSTMDEIDIAVKTLEKAGVNQLVLLHCVSVYPT
nr:N-acetylneuraminate synthase family protein [Pseudobutyrivibrio sp.]